MRGAAPELSGHVFSLTFELIARRLEVAVSLAG
jgi:hypothetical protein